MATRAQQPFAIQLILKIRVISQPDLNPCLMFPRSSDLQLEPTTLPRNFLKPLKFNPFLKTVSNFTEKPFSISANAAFYWPSAAVAAVVVVVAVVAVAAVVAVGVAAVNQKGAKILID